MASARVTSAFGGTARVGSRTTSSRTPLVEEIIPSSAWTEDSKGHYLLVDLPEFKKEQVKLHIDSNGRIIVKGERQANERKRVYFLLTFPMPLDSDADKVTGKFDGGILYVTVPKQMPQEHKETKAEQAANSNAERAQENEHQEQKSDEEERGHSQHDNHGEMEGKCNEKNAHIGEFSEGLIRKWGQEPRVRNAVSVLSKNRGIVITAVVAFSLGFLVSRKFG